MLYNKWLPQSDFWFGQHMCFEEYYMKSGIVKKVSLYLPITKKDKDFEITIEDLPEIKLLVCKNME